MRFDFFTARRYANAVYAMVLCLSVFGGGENRRLPRLFCTQSALVDVEITERLQRNVCFVAGRDFLQWPVVVHHN